MTDHPYTLGDFSIGDRVAWQLADGTYRVGTLTELNVKPRRKPDVYYCNTCKGPCRS